MKTCKEIAKLNSPAKKLSFIQKLESIIHIRFCKYCKIYIKHLQTLSNVISNQSQSLKASADKVRELEAKIINQNKKI